MFVILREKTFAKKRNEHSHRGTLLTKDLYKFIERATSIEKYHRVLMDLSIHGNYICHFNSSILIWSKFIKLLIKWPIMLRKEHNLFVTNKDVKKNLLLFLVSLWQSECFIHMYRLTWQSTWWGYQYCQSDWLIRNFWLSAVTFNLCI